jgi:hypothetical protein
MHYTLSIILNFNTVNLDTSKFREGSYSGFGFGVSR